MENYTQLNAYELLGVATDAKEEEIRLAYHRKIKEGNESENLTQAYGLIKDAKARERYFWNSVYSYFDPLKEPEKKNLDLDAVISEVAFLSDWELEEIDGS